MISEHVKRLYGRSGPSLWAGHIMLPCNVCARCGEEDDPEGYWAFDDDDDRICGKCERELADPLPLEHPKLVSITEYQLERSIQIVRRRKAS